MDIRLQPDWMRWRQAMDAGQLGLWDLRLELETVHYSPPWKQRLGFPEPQHADSTHFWRCRVHPADLEPMLATMREHARGAQPRYEARFRLRSNGSGYRLMHSRGRIIERGADGRALRMIGTMLDLTERAPTPQGGLPDGPRGPMAGAALALPFHLLLADAADVRTAQFTRERDRLLGLVEDLLRDTMSQLEGLSTART
jgi:hypothetical protein